MRVGDGSANPYLAIAAMLFAGLHGVRDRLALGPPVGGDAYTRRAEPGEPLPHCLDDALDALEGDDRSCAMRSARRSSTRSWP